MRQSANEQEAQDQLDDLRMSGADAKPGLGDWAVLILVGGFAIGVLIACWLLVAQMFGIAPP